MHDPYAVLVDRVAASALSASDRRAAVAALRYSRATILHAAFEAMPGHDERRLHLAAEVMSTARELREAMREVRP